jgi:hypothetical protein
MLASILSAIILSLSLLQAPASQPAKPSAQVLEPFVGEWTIQAKWDSGAELKARNVYAWGLGNKHVTTKTFIQLPDGKEYQRYDTIMSHSDRLGCFTVYGFGYDGAVTEHRMDVSEDGRVFKIGFEPLHAGEPSPIRQTITLAEDRKSFEWVVEANAKGEWKQMMRGTWVRKS